VPTLVTACDAANTKEATVTAIESSAIAKLVDDNEKQILSEWLDLQKKAGALATGRINEAELGTQCRDFLRLFRDALAKAGTDVANTAFDPVRDFLREVSRSRALQGFFAD
jgi:hypothetical protein